MQKAIFLDRDGTLIENGLGYPHKTEQLVPLPGVMEALKKVSKKYLLFIITNQSGIGRGYFTEDEFQIFNKALLEKMSGVGIEITETFHCPHRPDIKCNCRKPSPYFIYEAQKNYNLDLAKSWMIGDSESDMETASRAEVRGILITKNQSKGVAKSYSAEDFAAAIELISQYED